MPTILITGANRGIGLELARQYAAEGWRVIATCRDPEAAPDLAAVAGGVTIEPLDLRDRPAIGALAQRLAGTPIDLLFLNAGVNPQHGASLEQTDFSAWPEAFEINAIGPLFAAAAFLDHVAASDRKTIVAMGSMAGSFKSAMKANYLYRSTKAALHSVAKALADDVRDRGVTVVVMHPGRVRGARTPNNPLPVEESVSGMRKVIANLSIAQSGKFFNHEGAELPW